jgi:protein SCO1/2
MAETSPATRTLDEAAAPARSVLRSPFLWAFFAGIVLLTAIRPLLRHEPDPPALLGRLPAWRLVAADGRPFGSAELGGRVYVADFIFTRCASICPRLTDAMAALQRRLDAAGLDGVRLVSVSVDPDHDTPERLREYGERWGVDPRRWTLVTGELADVRRLVLEGFRTPLGEPDPDGNLVDIAHSTRLVLVDGSGGIRGYYDSDAAGVDEVFHRARQLVGKDPR